MVHQSRKNEAGTGEGNGIMKKFLLVVLILLPLTGWSASTNNWPMEEFDGDLENLPSLQSGFQL